MQANVREVETQSARPLIQWSFSIDGTKAPTEIVLKIIFGNDDDDDHYWDSGIEEISVGGRFVGSLPAR